MGSPDRSFTTGTQNYGTDNQLPVGHGTTNGVGTKALPEKIEYEVVGGHNEDRSSRSRCGRVFPTGFKTELKGLLKMGWPATLVQFFMTLMGVVSLMFCGRLGTAQLDAVGLALSLLNITGLSVVIGLSTACDTLFAQAFGGKNKLLMGIYLQRSFLVIILFICVSWCIHLNTEGILIVLGQNRTVARLAGLYALYFMPGLFFAFVFQILIRYMQNQNRILPTVVFGAIGNAVNAIAHYVAIYVLETGLIGSALSQSLAYFIMVVVGVVYILCLGLHRDTWSGFSWRAFEHWGQFLQLAVAGFVMTCIEWWAFEIGLFLNGLIGELELGATTVLFQIEQVIYMIPYGISVASSIRVGQSLGAANAMAAMTTSRVAQAFAFMSWVVVAILLASLKDFLPQLFTSDEELITLSSNIIPILILLSLMDCMVAVSMGTLRGSGRQWLGAAINALGYLVIALPMASLFMFVVGIGAYGIWWGLITGTVPAATLYIYFVMFRMNWDTEVTRTQDRLSRSLKPSDDQEKAPLLTTESAVDQTNFAGSDPCSGSIRPHIDEEDIGSLRSPKSFRLMMLKRLLAFIAALGVLVMGVCVRLFVPLPAESSHDLQPLANSSTWNISTSVLDNPYA